ncbi:MAG: hypothetical protein JXR52_12255 [Bacteroidales bacterium]|nr:hypothetical protein [Bacteroidales bacterium]MBN2699589.1 hypothetical protein [Bacteroidales bacterium]
MKLSSKFKNYGVIPIAVILILLGTACEQEPEKPVLPPLSSIVMDFSDFDQQPAQNKGAVPTYRNFIYAYSNVFFWNTFVTISLSLPVTAYSYALEQDAVYLGDNSWQWSFDFPWAQHYYTATLTSVRMNNEEFSVAMNINLKDQSGEGFTWLDGVVRFDHTHAEWNLYKNVEGTSVKVLEVDCNMNFETEEGDMRYTYVEPDEKETGSYIYFELFTPDSDVYDASYEISLSGGDIFIEWNRTSKAGRVMSTGYFEDELWHCWDANLMDVACGLD